MICKICNERYTDKPDSPVAEKAENWINDDKGFCSMECFSGKDAEKIRREEFLNSMDIR